MPVPLLVPILGAMAGTMAGPALGLGAAAAAGGAAAGGIGSLLAGAAPAALGAGIATLAAGGDPREALMNAALGGAGSIAMPAVTGALQGLAGPAAQKAAVTAARTPVQAAVSPTATAAAAAPTTSLRPMARPDGLGAAASSTPTGPLANLSGKDLMQMAKMMGTGQQQPQRQGPMSTPQVSPGRPGGAGQTAMVGGSPMMTSAMQQPSTPTAMDYTGGQSFATPPTGSMSMMPDSLSVGLGRLRPREQAMGQGFNMARGFV